MASFEFFAVIVSFLGLAASITYYALVVNNANKTERQQLVTRQAELFMNIYNQSYTNRVWADSLHMFLNLHWENLEEYNSLMSYTNPETRDNRLALATLIGFFEGVGVLIKENLLDIKLVALLMTGQIKDFWEKIEPIVEEVREFRNYPRFLSETEFLYNELMKYIKENPEIVA